VAMRARLEIPPSSIFGMAFLPPSVLGGGRLYRLSEEMSLRTTAASSLRSARWPLSSAVGIGRDLRLSRPGNKYLAGTLEPASSAQELELVLDG
jgi:hypothetical protein